MTNKEKEPQVPVLFKKGSSAATDAPLIWKVKDGETALIGQKGSTVVEGHSLAHHEAEDTEVPPKHKDSSDDEDLPIIRLAMQLLIQHAKDSVRVFSSFDKEFSLVQTSGRDDVQLPTDFLGAKNSSVDVDFPSKGHAILISINQESVSSSDMDHSPQSST